MSIPVLVHRLAERIYVQVLVEGGEALAVPNGGGVYVGDVTRISVPRVKGWGDRLVWMAHTAEGKALSVQETHKAAVAELLASQDMRVVSAEETIPPLFS